jgi:hypothetical protein
MTHRAFRGVVSTRFDLDFTIRTRPPHYIYLLMIENACLGISGSTKSMRIRARAYRQTFEHNSDRMPHDLSQGGSHVVAG